MWILIHTYTTCIAKYHNNDDGMPVFNSQAILAQVASWPWLAITIAVII